MVIYYCIHDNERWKTKNNNSREEMNDFKSMDAAIIIVTPDGIITSTSSTITASIFDDAAFIIIG